MTRSAHSSLPASALLSAALVWLISVTLCSTRVFGDTAHAPAATHAKHCHDSGDHPGKAGDKPCGCAAFKDFPAPSDVLTKAPAHPGALLYTLIFGELSGKSLAPTFTVQATGPPAGRSFAGQILRQCRLSHAPPMVV